MQSYTKKQNGELLGLSGFQTALQLLCKLEQEKIRRYKEEIKKMPQGVLYMNKHKNYIFFQCAVDGIRKSISNDEKLIYQLARKKYLQYKIKSFEQGFCYGNRKITLDNHGVDRRIRKMLTRYGDAGLDVMRITCSEEQYRWAHADYERNMYKPEERKYKTYSGIWVRSKSEQKIGNELELNGIPYRYEQLLDLYIGWMEGVEGGTIDEYRSYFPDFIILTATGELIIWEHLGRVDLKSYRIHNAEKICALRQGKGIKDEMFIMSFEKDFQDSEEVQRIISRRILPYM